MDFEKEFTAQLDALRDEGNYRIFANLERRTGEFPLATNRQKGAARDVTIWCSNDYLGMGHNKDVIEAMQQTAASCGAGAGGTRNISGTAHHHLLLEQELADLHNKEAALLFTSGYVSNWASLSTLGARLPNAVILSDSLNHASIIEGIRHSKAQKKIWKHNDVEDLIKQINQFVQETDEIIKAGSELKITCSKCCNGLECFKFKTKVKVINLSHKALT